MLAHAVFGKKLQSLARKGDPELLTTLESCCEGGSYNQETFDEAYFLQNARDIIQEDDEEEEEGKMEKHQQQLSKH